MVDRRDRELRQFGSVAAAVALLVVGAASPCWTWGPVGHRVITKLAERHLTERAQAEIRTPLEPGESMADASTWADEIRGKVRRTAPWHYIDVPLDEPRFGDRFAWDEPRKGYVVPKIRGLRIVLKDRSRSAEERRQALRFLVHLIQELHMPLHVQRRDRPGSRQWRPPGRADAPGASRPANARGPRSQDYRPGCPRASRPRGSPRLIPTRRERASERRHIRRFVTPPVLPGINRYASAQHRP
jgi:hypothetical protein